MSYIYGYLSDYGLSKPGKVEKRLTKFSENKLSKFFESYEGLMASQPPVLRAVAGATDLYPDSHSSPLSSNLVRHLALYANRIYLHDPLLKAADEWKNIDAGLMVIIEKKPRNERIFEFKTRLAESIEEILKVRPLAEAGIVHISSAELIKFRKDNRRLYASDFYTADGPFLEHAPIPRLLSEYESKHVEVFPARYQNRELIIDWNSTSISSNVIAVRIKDDPRYGVYHYSHITPVEGGQPGEVQMFFPTESNSIDELAYKNWENGLRHEIVETRMNNLSDDLYLAAAANARFITNLPASKRLATLNLDSEIDSTENDVITAFLSLELPYFDKVTYEQIAKARQNEVSFSEFQSALEDAFLEIDALPDTRRFQEMIDQISSDLLHKAIIAVNSDMKHLRGNLFIEGILGLGSLTAALMKIGTNATANSLLAMAAIFAATHAARMYKDDRDERYKFQKTPGYFYWNLVKDQM